MSSLKKLIAIALLSAMWAGCSCDPIIAPPDGGGTGGGTGTAGGSTAGGAGGGNGGGTAGGTAGGSGGGVAGGAGGGTAGGAGGGTAGGTAGGVEFTQYVHDLIVNDTNGTSAGRPASEWQNLPDTNPITFTASFFDGGN